MTLPAPASLALGTVLLAAGRSSRLGQPKLLLPWGRTSVLGHLLEQWRDLGAAQIAVVCAGDTPSLPAELARLGFPEQNRILNPAPERGMFSSIQAAAAWPGWDPRLTHWAIVLGDQPHLRLETLRRLLACAARNPARVCQPAAGGRPRHPVVLPKTLFRQLAVSPAADLKEFLAAQDPATCPVDDPGLDLDIDRLEDYQRALALAFGPRGGASPGG